MHDKKLAAATVATGFLEDMILERFILGVLPGEYSVQTIKKLTGYNFLSFKKYIVTDYFTLQGKIIKITNDTELLKKKSKTYCEKLVKKSVFPAKYEHDEFIYNIGRYHNENYYTQEEKRFIKLMLKELFCIIYDDIEIKITSPKKLLKYNLINNNCFKYVAVDIYNAIIRGKLRAGDNVMPFIMKTIKEENIISEKLKSCSVFDYLYDENAILKCDLNTNTNLLIKNFLNLTIYNFYDLFSRLILLMKLNSKYSFLISDKIFIDFE